MTAYDLPGDLTAHLADLRRGSLAECTEDMTAYPCGKPAVAARWDPHEGGLYPVCTRHARTPELMVPLATALAAGDGTQTSTPSDTAAVERAARAIDPDAWNLHPTEFLREYGGAPRWSSQHQDSRRDESIDLARTALAAARAGEADREALTMVGRMVDATIEHSGVMTRADLLAALGSLSVTIDSLATRDDATVQGRTEVEGGEDRA